MGNRAAITHRDPEPDLLPRLPLDKKIPPYALRRRGGVSAAPTLQNGSPPIRRPKYKRRGGVCYERTDVIAVYIRNLGDALSKQGRGSDFIECDDLPEVPSNILAHDIALPSYAYRRGSVQEKLPPSVMYRKLLKDSIINTVGLDPVMIENCNVTRFLDCWNFDLFAFGRLCEGRPLYHLGLRLFQKHNLFANLCLDHFKVMRFLSLAEQSYHGENPYHNGTHATDVTQALNCLISVKEIYSKLTPIELLAAFIAAILHDVDHPGVNQCYLVNSCSYLAILHGNSSTLEHHHCCTAKAIIAQSGILDHFSPPDKEQIMQIMQDLVLATDMTRHKEYVIEFEQRREVDNINLDVTSNRMCMLKIALKCADISNPTREWSTCEKWSKAVMEEFFRQGDNERKLSLPISFLCDRHTINIPESQKGFIGFVVEPLFNMWRHQYNNELSNTICHTLATNKLCWSELCPKETDTESDDSSS